MRKLVIVAAALILCIAAVDASACAQCGTYATGCDFCYESGYDGAEACELWQGEYCMLTNEGACEGYLERWCSGGHCPDDKEARSENDRKEWQFASVTVIRPKPAQHAARS
jgi:hypothetical protein